MGIPVTLVSIAYLWVIYLLFSLKKTTIWNMAAISVLLGIPVSFIINYIVAQFIEQPIISVWNVFSWGIQVVVAMVLFFIGRYSN